MKTILALIGLGTLLYGAHLYRHSFDPKPMVERYDQKLDQAQQARENGARTIEKIQDKTGVEIVSDERLDTIKGSETK